MAAPAVATVAKFIPWDKVIKWGALLIAAIVALVALFFVMVVTMIVGAAQEEETSGPVGDIPAQLMPIYQGAAATCPGLHWSYVAAIGYTESRHASGGTTLDAGLNLLPPLINPQSVHFGGGRYENARGPMQFLPSTFAAHATDGNGDGVTSIDNYADSIYTAVAYLCSMNAGQGGENPGDPLYQALWHYGYRTSALMQRALDKAAEYRALAEAAAAGGGGGAGGPVTPGLMPAPSGPVPIGQTTLVTTATGATVRVYTPAAANWQALFDLARSQGVPLSGWGWRDPQTQIRLREQRCPGRVYDRSCKGSPPTAVPGSSRHEFGVAIDFTCPSSTIPSHSGPCWNFLAQYGAQFGVKNLPSEPWHWSADGR